MSWTEGPKSSAVPIVRIPDFLAWHAPVTSKSINGAEKVALLALAAA
jgi:hypothetical protein